MLIGKAHQGKLMNSETHISIHELSIYDLWDWIAQILRIPKDLMIKYAYVIV